MLTTLTSWLRPSSARHRKAALRAVEHLEDRAVPDATPHNLFTGPLTQDWTVAGVIAANDNWSGASSIIGRAGTGLGLSPGADPRTLITTNTGAPQVTADVTGNPEDVTSSGIAEFQSLGVVAFRPDATNQAPNLVIHLSTTGVNATRVQFDVKDINPAGRDAVQQLAVQYRLSTDADFILVPGGYFADVTTAGTGTQAVSVVLPTRADDLPAGTTVEVRIIATQAAGDNEWFGIDNIQVSANRRPSLNILGADPTWTEGLTANTAVQITPTVPVSPQPPTVTDPDAPANLGTGALTVSITSGGVAAEDVLGVNNQGTGAGQIGVTGANVSFGGTNIGTTSGGTNGNPLVITLNTNANLTAVSALVRQVTYNNTSQDPTVGPRVIQFVLRDNAGGVSLPVTRTVNTVAVNDAPTVNAGPGQSLFEDRTLALTGVVLGDVDVRTADLTVTLALTAGSGTLNLRTDVAGGVTPAQVTNNDTGTVTVLAPLAAINATLAATDGLVYTPGANFNTDSAPPVQLTVTADDNGNTPGPAQNASASKVVTVTGINDAPVANPVGAAARLTAPDRDLPFTLASVPPGGALTLADITGVTDAAGAAVDITGATLAGVGNVSV